MRTRLFHAKQQPPLRKIFVVGWTGMRGVVSLAAAFALPASLSDNNSFPQRNLIVFLTFCAICVTLVLQGVTLPPLIRALKLDGAAGRDREEIADRAHFIHLCLDALRVDRQTAIRLRDQSLINDETLRVIERHLDLTECRLTLVN